MKIIFRYIIWEYDVIQLRESYGKLREFFWEKKWQPCYVPFIGIAESWLKPFITDVQLNMENYNIYRADREHSRNGGSLLYIHRDIIVDISSSYDDDICSGVACLSKKSNCIIVCLYRPPGSSEQSFSKLLDFFSTFFALHNPLNRFHKFIFGDFNFPQISWNNFNSLSYKTPQLVKLFNFMDKELLNQYVVSNTRKNNLLDLFFTDNSNFVQHIKTEDVAFSDHRLLKIFNTFFSPIIKDTVPKQKDSLGLDFSIFNLQTANFKEINRELFDVDWSVLMGSSIQDFPDHFRKIIYGILQRHTKINFSSSSKNKGFLNRSLHTINRKIRKLKNRLKYSNHLSNYVKFTKIIRNLENQKNQVFLDKRLADENKAISKIKSDNKYFFKYANRFKVASSSPNLFLDKNHNAISDPKLISNMLQDQFKGVFSTPLTESEIKDYDIPQTPSTNPLPFFQITCQDIVTAINEIKPSSSCTRNDIPAKVFKECKFSISKPLKLLWERSLESGEIPSKYKNQTIIPLHKKGSRAKPENFRPISLTPHEIKIIERVLRRLFSAHMEGNNLLNINQHGFRENHSCCTQLLAHTNYIFSNSIIGNEIDCIYIDYAKAFDKVDHGLLLKKVELYGIT